MKNVLNFMKHATYKYISRKKMNRSANVMIKL